MLDQDRIGYVRADALSNMFDLEVPVSMGLNVQLSVEYRHTVVAWI